MRLWAPKAGLTKTRINKLVEAYRRKKLRQYSETLTRTATIKASAQAQRQLWLQSKEKGWLDQEKWVVKWIITPDDRLCEFCLRMKGKTREMDGTYENGSEGPTLHWRCRCAEGLVKRTTGKPARTAPAREKLKAKAKPRKPKSVDEIGALKTTAEAEAWVGHNYKGVIADFTGMDMKAVQPTLRQFRQLAGEYPDVAKRIKYIGVYSDKTKITKAFGREMSMEIREKAYAHAGWVWKNPRDFTAGRSYYIGLNTNWYGNATALKKSLKKGVRVGWHAKGCDSIESLFTHEFGHHVETWLKDQSKVFSPYLKADGLGHVRDTVNLWQKNHKATKSLCRYALTSEGEAFAEGFASLKHAAGKKSAFAENLGKLLKTVGNPQDWKDQHVAETLGDLSWDEKPKAIDMFKKLEKALGLRATL
jgi:hypothetical protein